jgi:DnaK suppressor protein
VSASGAADLEAAVAHEIARTDAQIAALERSVAAIVEAAELTSTDDEHDPEGATIAYERAQALALLRQAREDRQRLADVRATLQAGEPIVCATCGAPIVLERLLALPTARMCVRCAS